MEHPANADPLPRWTAIALFLAVAATLTAAWHLSTLQVFDLDEGYDLMRALLWRHGFSLYRRIWCDQPPLFTLCLAGTHTAFGSSLPASRIMVAGAAFVFLFALYRLVRCRGDRIEAALTIAFLLTAAYFLRVSVSVMETLPSLALALAGLWLAQESGRSNRTALAAASGFLLAAAALVKLNMLFLFPLAPWCLHTHATAPARTRLWLTVVWVLARLSLFAKRITFFGLIAGRMLGV